MPYDPGISYRGDQYLYQGITGAAGAIAGGIEDWQKKHDETQQKLQTADLLKEYADKRGFTTPEFTAKYAAANADQKAKMAAGLSQTIVLQAHDAEKKAELQNAIDVANIHAAAVGQGRAGQRGPATAEELAYAQSYAPPGYNAVPTATGWQLVGKDPGMAKEVPVHKPGELILDPVDASKPPIGMWQKNDEIKYFSEVDPFKKKIAEAMDEYNASKGGQTDTSFATAHPVMNALIFGRPGSLANPTPSPMPAPTPAVTPGPVIAPVATPPPVAAAGSTVANVVKTQADFDALPSGAIFQAPDGSVRRKP